jgi:hypothetical protein
MMPQPGMAPRRRFGIAGGMLRLALFRAEGMAGFPDSTQGFLNSFAPMVALTLVGAFLVAMGGELGLALESLSSTIVAMLAQPVISHWLARRWGREAPWLRYATAVNWCQWAPMLAIFVLMPLVQIAIGFGFTPEVAAVLLIVVLLAYAMALSWFLARVGLGVSRWRAALLVVVVHAVIAVIVEGPLLLGGG